MAGSEAARWRFLITPRWLAWHLFTVAAVIGMLMLGDWQLHRALAGNGLSWAYTFEWPIFAIFGVVFWGKTIRDEFRPPEQSTTPAVLLPAGAYPVGAGAAEPGEGAAMEPSEMAEDDADLAAYNAYLARLHKEVKGHGKWHGLR